MTAITNVASTPIAVVTPMIAKIIGVSFFQPLAAGRCERNFGLFSTLHNFHFNFLFILPVDFFPKGIDNWLPMCYNTGTNKTERQGANL